MVSDRLKDYLDLEPDLRLGGDNDSLVRFRNASLFQNSYVMRDPIDGKLFLDYMNFMPAEDQAGHTRLVRHREWVIDGLNEHKNDDNPNIFQKFEWMRDYHNEWCSMFEAHRDDFSELMISDASW